MAWAKTKAFVVTIMLSVGILFSKFDLVSLSTAKLWLLISVLILFAVAFLKYHSYRLKPYFAIAVSLFYFSLGAWVYQLHQPLNNSKHYSHFIETDIKYTIGLQITSSLRSTAFHNRYEAKVIQVDDKTTTGKILLLVPKEVSETNFIANDVVWAYSSFQLVRPALNPHQFDYAAFLKNQGIYHQVPLQEPLSFVHTSGKTNIYRWAENFRASINSSLVSKGFEGEPLALINSLLLGQRQELSREIYTQFSAAGVVHILAISGLHVGIILLLLRGLFSPLIYMRYGKKMRLVLLLVCMWLFALITGLSPSVLRAVTMFSVVAIVLETGRHNLRFSGLLSAAFILLLIKPSLLFQIGFQMSFLAVFAILWIVPMLEPWRPKNLILRFFYDIATVTLAAQLGVGPLSVYYFNYFPGLFFLTNMVVLPFLGIILGGGLLVIALSKTSFYPSILTEIYSDVLFYLLKFIHWVAQQDRFYFEGIVLSLWQLISIYLLLFSLLLFIQKIEIKRFRFVVLSFLLLQLSNIYENQKIKSSEFVIFHKSKATLLGLKDGKKLTLFSSSDSLSLSENNMLKNYKAHERVNEIQYKPLKEVHEFNGSLIVLIDSLALYPKSATKVDLLILRNSPKVHPERLLDSLQPKIVVADGSNFNYYTEVWKKATLKRNIPFYHTGKTGYYKIRK